VGCACPLLLLLLMLPHQLQSLFTSPSVMMDGWGSHCTCCLFVEACRQRCCARVGELSVSATPLPLVGANAFLKESLLLDEGRVASVVFSKLRGSSSCWVGVRDARVVLHLRCFCNREELRPCVAESCSLETATCHVKGVALSHWHASV